MSPFFFQKLQDQMVCLLFSFKSIGILLGEMLPLPCSLLYIQGRCLHKMNFTHIVLVPEMNDPQHITEFCLIGLSNVVFRIVSKVLANRLKTILLNVISDSQSALYQVDLLLIIQLWHLRCCIKCEIGGEAVLGTWLSSLISVKHMIEWNGFSLEG